MIRRNSISFLLLLFLGLPGSAGAELPIGYLVWTHGDVGSRLSRKCWRMTLPGMDDAMPITAGEDVECQVSPDGKWVAYAKAKLPNWDYHNFKQWMLYVVSIHGTNECRDEIRIDERGYWPSWGADGTLYYAQVDEEHEEHTVIMRATLDDFGNVVSREVHVDTWEHFPDAREMTVGETYVAPDGTWFVARTRLADELTGVAAFQIDPPLIVSLASAGSFGCMPKVAPDGEWAVAAGRTHGIRWGEAPGVAEREYNELLIPQRSSTDLLYHPGFSTDGAWVLAAHGEDNAHQDTAYSVYLYALDRESMTIDEGQVLAGDGFNGWPSVWVGKPSAPPPSRPRILEFYPDSWTIVSGESVELTWEAGCADGVTLDGAPVGLAGSMSDSPAATTTYTLVATNSELDETVTDEVVVTVNDAAEPVVIESFSVEPATITQGEIAELTWVVKNPTTLDIDGQQVRPSGSMEISPTETSSFILTAQGHQGPVTRTVEVTVEEIEIGIDDRGGCFCGAGSVTGVAMLAICGLIGLIRRRRFS